MKKNYVEKSLNVKEEFEEEITKKIEELRDLLVNYIEIYNTENEDYSDIKKLIKVL